MGIRKKEHRKKVAARNQRIKAEQSAMQKVFDKSMKEQLEDLKKKYEEAKLAEQQQTK